MRGTNNAWVLVGVIAALSCCAAASELGVGSVEHPTLQSWFRMVFQALPCNDGVALTKEPKLQSILHPTLLEDSVEQASAALETPMIDSANWFAGPDSPLVDPAAWWATKTQAASGRLATDLGSPAPFMQRVLLPTGATVAVFGDLHGSIHSVLRSIAELQHQGFLCDWKVCPDKQASFFMMFLGDYVDRGAYGAEVVYTLTRLKTHNPANIILVRGNHEDEYMNSHGGTFTHEVLVKYGEDRGEEVLTKIFRFYDRLPVAAFVGAAGPLASPDQDRAYLLACHGGWEPGWSPRDWFANDDEATQFTMLPPLKRQTYLATQDAKLVAQLPKRVIRQLRDYEHVSDARATTPPLGFMWADFFVHDEHTLMHLTRNRGFVHGKQLTQKWMTDASVVAILRAHQHNNAEPAGPMLDELEANHGIFDNWNHSGMVFTFLSATECPGFSFLDDSFGLLTIGAPQDGPKALTHCHHALKTDLPAAAAATHISVHMTHRQLQSCSLDLKFQCHPVSLSGRSVQELPVSM